MPGSSTILDSLLIEDLQYIKPKTAWEVGCGKGRIGGLIKRTVPGVALRGFDIHEQYLIDHKKTLGCYNELTVCDFSKWVFENVDWWVDLIIFPDVLEHMPLSAVIDVLDNAKQRTRYIIMKIPLRYKQNTMFNNLKEAHVSEPLLIDLIRFDVRKYIVEEGDGWGMSYVLIKGWL